jgi:hypothetical protein
MIGEVAKLYQGEFDKYGVNAESFLLTMANIESTFNSTVTNSAGYQGLYQFSPKLAMDAKDGYNIGNTNAEVRKDPVWSTAAAAQMALDNAKGLQKNGIEVTSENLYLAHQQGISSTVALLKNGNLNVVDTLVKEVGLSRKLAEKSILQNAGSLDMKSSDFLKKWINKYQEKTGK